MNRNNTVSYNHDLEKERKTCSFDMEEVTNILDGGVYQTRRRRHIGRWTSDIIYQPSNRWTSLWGILKGPSRNIWTIYYVCFLTLKLALNHSCHYKFISVKQRSAFVKFEERKMYIGYPFIVYIRPLIISWDISVNSRWLFVLLILGLVSHILRLWVKRMTPDSPFQSSMICSHQYWRLVQQRPSMCYHVYVIMHVNNP